MRGNSSELAHVTLPKMQRSEPLDDYDSASKKYRGERQPRAEHAAEHREAPFDQQRDNKHIEQEDDHNEHRRRSGRTGAVEPPKIEYGHDREEQGRSDRMGDQRTA